MDIFVGKMVKCFVFMKSWVQIRDASSGSQVYFLRDVCGYAIARCLSRLLLGSHQFIFHVEANSDNGMSSQANLSYNEYFKKVPDITTSPDDC